MYNTYKLSEYKQQIYNADMTLADYADQCVIYITAVINHNNKNAPFPLKPSSAIIFSGSEALSIELAKAFSKHKSSLKLRNILIDNPATSYEQAGSEAIERLIASASSIQELTYKRLTESSTYEQDLIITGATYAGVEYSDYNLRAHTLLVKCVDSNPQKTDKFLYDLTDFYRAPNSFCDDGMYSVLTIT